MITIILIIINTLLSALILLLPNANRHMKICLFCICVFLPVLGILGLILVYILKKCFVHQTIDKDELSVKLAGLEYISDINYEKEVNIVPVEEALLYNSDKTKRTLVMEAMKDNPLAYLKSLRKALSADDSETAHYAASGITNVKRILEKQLAETRAAYKKAPTDLKLITSYIDALKQMINSELCADVMLKQYQFQLVSVLKDLIATTPSIPITTYCLIIDTLVDLDSYSEAINYANQFAYAYPENEQPYVYMLNIAYILKNDTVFQQALHILKQAHFPTSLQTRNTIAYWDRINEK